MTIAIISLVVSVVCLVGNILVLRYVLRVEREVEGRRRARGGS